MKKIISLALSLVLTGALFAGCGCTNTGKNETTTPTGAPTSAPTTLPTTMPTTAPTTQNTQPSMEESTPTGNGAMEDESTGPESTREAEGRARSITPGSRSNSGANGGSGSSGGMTGGMGGNSGMAGAGGGIG